MYAVTSIPFVRRTLATLRSAELGFFGVCVRTWVQTPRFCGDPESRLPLFLNELNENLSAGALSFFRLAFRPFRTNWFTVGIAFPNHYILSGNAQRKISTNKKVVQTGILHSTLSSCQPLLSRNAGSQALRLLF